MKKPKYMKRVFSGKDVPVIGLDQGKGPLYRGDGVGSVFNAYFDSCLEPREGHVIDITYTGGINAGGRLKRVAFIGEGNRLWAEAI
jgi:hypothetical protein